MLNILKKTLVFIFLTYFFVLLVEFFFFIQINYYKTDKVQNFLAEQKKVTYSVPFENKIIRPIDFLITKQLINFKDQFFKNFEISLGGQPNRDVFVCNEEYPVYTSLDYLGFRNDNKDYLRNNNILLIGDSFAFGECVKDDQNIKGNLEKNNHKILNFSIGGAFPFIYGEYLNLYEKLFNNDLEHLIVTIHTNDFGAGFYNNSKTILNREYYNYYINNYHKLFEDFNNYLVSNVNSSIEKKEKNKIVNSSIEKNKKKIIIKKDNFLKKPSRYQYYLITILNRIKLTIIKKKLKDIYTINVNQFEQRLLKDNTDLFLNRAFTFCKKFNCKINIVFMTSHPQLDLGNFKIHDKYLKLIKSKLIQNYKKFNVEYNIINTYDLFFPLNDNDWPSYGSHYSASGYKKISNALINSL